VTELFRDDGALRPLRLADIQVTSTGAVIATTLPQVADPAMASGTSQGLLRALSAASAARMSRSRGWFRPWCDGGTMAAAEYEE
jgi:hypothetical protein